MRVPAYPGAAEMLRRLKEAGFVLCTATSKPTVVVTPILEEQGLAPYFDFIGGASMDESGIQKQKWCAMFSPSPVYRASGC